MWQGINNITGFKGNKPATVNIAASLPDELNHFYARFEAHKTAHTESAPAAAAEEVSPRSISIEDVTRSFRLNIRWISGKLNIRISTCLNDWRPVALTPIFSKCFEKLVRDYICSVLPASLDLLQFAYRSNRSTNNAIAFTLHTALSHLENKYPYVRMLFVD